jgi:hypothetical protein
MADCALAGDDMLSKAAGTCGELMLCFWSTMQAMARLLVFLSFPAMQRWIVKDFLQAGSLQRAGLDIDMPIFCQDPRLIQIVVCDVQRRTVK